MPAAHQTPLLWIFYGVTNCGAAAYKTSANCGTFGDQKTCATRGYESARSFEPLSGAAGPPPANAAPHARGPMQPRSRPDDNAMITRSRSGYHRVMIALSSGLDRRTLAPSSQVRTHSRQAALAAPNWASSQDCCFPALHRFRGLPYQ